MHDKGNVTQFTRKKKETTTSFSWNFSPNCNKHRSDQTQQIRIAFTLPRYTDSAGGKILTQEFSATDDFHDLLKRSKHSGSRTVMTCEPNYWWHWGGSASLLQVQDIFLHLYTPPGVGRGEAGVENCVKEREIQNMGMEELGLRKRNECIGLERWWEKETSRI